MMRGIKADTAAGRRRAALLWQLLALAILLGLFAFLAYNTQENMRLRGIRSGFDFLGDPAGFDIGESLLAFSASDPYWKAFLVGLLNTLRVAIVGIALASVLGVVIGMGRLSRNLLLRWLCGAYIELFRNLPLLLQLLVWYFMLTAMLPPVADALQLGELVYLSKSGLAFPAPLWDSGHLWAGAGFAAGCVLWVLLRRGLGLPARLSFLLPLALALGGWLAGGMPASFEIPERGIFNISGGITVTPEFLALLVGLSLYTAAFIAENVRAGIQSVPWGQLEAAGAVGLSRRQTMRWVVFPQALRVIIPPTANQYLNLTKNSSLAVAIGYPDLISITNTSLNQTGRAVECIAVMMAMYLLISLLTAWLMHRHGRQAQLEQP